MTVFVYLIFNCDTGQHLQFLRCFSLDNFSSLDNFFSHCLELPYWHYQLVLTWYPHQTEIRTQRSDQGHLGPIKIIRSESGWLPLGPIFQVSIYDSRKLIRRKTGFPEWIYRWMRTLVCGREVHAVNRISKGATCDLQQNWPE